MINKTVARRYAQALFEIGREQNAVGKFAQDLKNIVGIIESSEDIKKIIYGRLVPAAAKKEIMSKIVPGDAESMVVNFVNLVIEKSRESYLVHIVRAFEELVDRENKILPARVLSASFLTDEQVAELEEKLSKMTGKRIRATINVDPSLIGGIAVRIGDIVYDGSIAKQLGMLKEHLQQIQLGR